MSFASIMAKLSLDSSGFNSNMDGATKKVSILDTKIQKFGVTMKSLKGIMGIGLGIQLIDKMGAAMEHIIELSEKGVHIVSDQDVANMKEVTGQLDQTKNQLTSWAATFGMYLLGGLQDFVSYVGARAGGANEEDAWKIAADQGKEEISNKDKERIAETLKKAAESTEKLREAALTNQEKLTESEKKMLHARQQYGAEMKLGGKDVEFLAKQTIIINEESEKQMKLRDEIGKKEKNQAADIANQSKERESRLEKYKDQEQEIANIREKAGLIGATFEEKIAANKREQLRLQEEVKRAGGDEWQKKKKELAEVEVQGMELENKKKNQQKEMDKIRKDAAEQIAKLTDPKRHEVSVSALAGASHGMYLGGVDRSSVGRLSKSEMLQTKTNEILTRMNDHLAQVAQGG